MSSGPHEHPPAHRSGLKLYLAIAVTLAILTYVEVQMPVLMDQGPLLIGSLLAAAVAKAGLVMAFYMHLKGDSRVYTGIVVLALLLVAYFAALLVLPVQH
jgi:cytochrome c oxidase subunit IV